MQLKTVNVIEQGESINAIRSFTDDAEGNAEAEAIFRSIAKENASVTDEEIDAALDDGWFQDGTYTCTIIHSS